MKRVSRNIEVTLKRPQKILFPRFLIFYRGYFMVTCSTVAYYSALN